MSIWSLKATGAASDRPPDVAEMRRAMAVLADPAASQQVQALPSAHWLHLSASDPAALADAAAALAERTGQSVYYLLNPIPAGLGRPARNADALARRWLLVDVDRKKDEHSKNLSATGAEKEASRAVADAVRAHLDGLGWPAPVVIDSGNGWHLLYRVELPNDLLSAALIRAVTHALAASFDTPAAEVDRSTHDARRCSKLPGCWAQKGPDTPERPHRPCRLLSAPEAPEPVPVALLQALAQPATVPLAPPSVSPWTQRASSSSGTAWARAALERCSAQVALAAPGERNKALNKAAYSLGGYIASGLLDRAAVEATLTLMAERCGLAADTACGPEGIAATIRSGIDKGLLRPRQAPGPTANGTARSASAPADGPLIIRASQVRTRRVEWLWPGRIPLAKMTTFAGMGGVGKTFVLCDIAARVSAGLPWPDAEAGGECATPGQVLFISGEDDPEDTLVPRLIECGADLGRVAFLASPTLGDFHLGALKTLEAAVGQVGPDTRLVVIDPPTSFICGVDDHKNAELRSLLTPLKEWCQAARLALVFNTHFNKGSGGKVEAMMRVLGGVAWVNAVRVAHAFAKDPQDATGERRLFVPMKRNIGRERKGLAYKILPLDDDDDRARVEWLGEADVSADEAVNRDSRPKKRRVEAADWLAGLFDGADEIASKRIFTRAAVETHLSPDALREAKEDMGIRATQKDNGEGRNQWVWYWPTAAREGWQRRCAREGGGPDEEVL